MISAPSSVMPLIASQGFPRGGLPMIRKTRSRRLTCPWVSRRCLLKAAANSLDCAAFAILGSVLIILLFGEVDVLERLMEKVAQLLLRPARATHRRFSLLRSFSHDFSCKPFWKCLPL